MFGVAIIDIDQPEALSFFSSICEEWNIETDLIACFSRRKWFIFIDDDINFQFMQTIYQWGNTVRFLTIEEIIMRSYSLGLVQD